VQIKLSMRIFLISCIYLFLNVKVNANKLMVNTDLNLDTIVLGAGCFWCVEAIFQQIGGVKEVIPGYCGGQKVNPTYEEVCSGNTQHVEVARVVFDTELVTLSYLLEVFWTIHDPTTIDRQGNDIGSQYRSAIFCLNESQRELALAYKDQIDLDAIWDNPLVTQIEILEVFYPAENYHHNYYNNNINQGYCKFVIQPKLEKFKKVFSDQNTPK
jgi:peptide-methionine (S)-S-oxide reductase